MARVIVSERACDNSKPRFIRVPRGVDPATLKTIYRTLPKGKATCESGLPAAGSKLVDDGRGGTERRHLCETCLFPASERLDLFAHLRERGFAA